MNIITTSATETKHLGKIIGALITAPITICLEGSLGAGKTTFTQGLAQGLDISADVLVTSPTYALLHEYQGGRHLLIHADLYRLEGGEEDLENIGFYDLLSTGVVIVEWAERLDQTTRGDALIISFRTDIANEHRHINISANGHTAEDILQKIAHQIEGVKL